VKAAERWEVKPIEAVIQDATANNHALAERVREETAEQRRQRQYAKEVGEFNNARAQYQGQLDRWWQSKLDAERAIEDDDYMVGGFLERRRPSCHRGKGDPDWRLR
jgi:hypothetical protein